jgi:hypothetical protein
LAFWGAFSVLDRLPYEMLKAFVVLMPNMGIYLWHSAQVQNADSDSERQKLAFWEVPPELLSGGT